MNLQQLGFTQYFETQLQTLTFDRATRLVGRIILEHKHSYRVLTEQGEFLATVSGNFAYHAFSRKDYPAVGDFVIIEQMPGKSAPLFIIYLTVNQNSQGKWQA